MKREQFLRNRLEMASHNLMCYSADYSMTEPKEGFEAEYKEASEEVEMLQAWLKEFCPDRSDAMREFIGHINGTQCGKTWNGEPRATEIEFEVDTGERYTRGDVRNFHLGVEVQGWFIGENNTCGKYDKEKDRRDSRLLKITVDSINFVRHIEWAVNEER